MVWMLGPQELLTQARRDFLATSSCGLGTLASAFPGTDLVEHLTGSPFIDEITVGGCKLDADGMLKISTTPGQGLGLELDPEAVRKYTGGGSPL